MANLNADLYDALRAAGVSDDLARKAGFSVVDNDKELSVVKTDLLVLKWMVGTNIALTIALFFKAFA